jgi:hypothetical protein
MAVCTGFRGRLWAGVGLAAALLSACGGGNSGHSSQLLSGSVAVLSFPMARAAVQLRCADGSAFSTSTDDQGVWQLVVATQPLPCALQASGGTVDGVANSTAYQSVATGFGVNNITLLSTLALARLTGQDPQAWFASPAFAGVTTASRQAALDTVGTALGMETVLSQFNPFTEADVAHPLLIVLSAIQHTLTDPAVNRTEAQLLQAARSGDFSGFASFATHFASWYADLSR